MSQHNDDIPIEEDILAEGTAVDEEEEGEGEDLFGDDMIRDYERNPEEDQYDPELLDDTHHEPMSIEQRRAVERALDERDGRVSPARRLLADEDVPVTPPPRNGRADGSKRRRVGDGTPYTSSSQQSPGIPGTQETTEEVTEAMYDLNGEEWKDGIAEDRRLQAKIRRCFQQFLRKYTPKGHGEPKYPDLVRRMAEENHMHLDISFSHLQEWSANLALWVSDYPLAVLPLLNETLMIEAKRKYETYAQMALREEKELRVGIFAFPVSEPIRELNTRHINKLVNVQGVVTRRTKVCNQVKRLFLQCAKCGYPSGPFDVAEDKDLKPGACIECQSKGPWRVDREKTLYRNHQRITLQESPSSVEPGKMPRSKDVMLTGDQIDTVRPGDELSLTGVYRCLYDAASNARTCFPVFKTEIESVHVYRKGDVRLVQITDEQTAQILELGRHPHIRERIIASMAPSIYGMKHVKEAITLSIMGGQGKVAAGKHRIRGDINTLIVGDPGLAKSQFLKYIEKIFPRAVYTTGKGASAVGLTAAVMRDENGDWSLQGGAMVLADDGICLIDEFDKMNDQDRTSIHEAMEQQTISVSKAGIVATLQARCAVVAVGNPVDGRYDAQKTFAQNVNLSDPILSRFDLLCVLRDEQDPVQDECLAEHVLCSHIRSHPDATTDDKQAVPRVVRKDISQAEPIDQDLLQKYIIFCRQRVHPKLTDIDKEKLASFYRDIREASFRSGGAPMTARHIESIIRLAEANARLELRQHVLPKDLDNAMYLIFESFRQSQKHQVAEDLRRRFRKYIKEASPISDQVMNLVEKLFKEKISMASHTGGEVPDITAVPVEMADILREVERQDLDLDQAHSFFSTDRFRANFRLEGEQLFHK
mmetsp:Transcript_11333/g.26100  ORF Transcript_11333/g.26100 Transcript_11333/m.26100 type:complete len:875 (+) Transcript_11333:74-2698(+)|eukprot:CAMPEP_0178408068 /NCGR_PEP_ID=MMETSP0689_2-20121128/19750_1 /TAXON_ID=160604 /ORGANISM="Amphidinium massartii, Strain CS-259" /LENGTH=874 /DNA_ID=CAMNT_0020029155 /DNA_START=49 /DNA_END=2673 /DNA_ORIENTATION=+